MYARPNFCEPPAIAKPLERCVQAGELWDIKVGWSYQNPFVSTPAGAFWTPYVSGNPEWHPNHNVCPNGWRLPTPEEFASLAEAENEYTWVSSPTVIGQSGRKFGSNNNTIFLPAQGYRYWSGGTLDRTTRGYYWSSTLGSGGNAFALSFTDTNVTPNNLANPSYGFCVRCVSDGTTGVNEVSEDTENLTVTGYFDILGRKLNAEPKQGVYIILFDNGTTKKVVK